MNIQNLDSNESLGVKFKDATYAELCIKLWFLKATDISVILLNQDVLKVTV